MPILELDSLDDPRLAAFRNLSKRSAGKRSTQDKFVVEGQLIVRRLIESDHVVDTVVVQRERPLEELGEISDEINVIRLSRAQIRELAGFDFHRGFLASAFRPAPLTIDHLDADPVSLAAIQITDMENLGSMIRSASAFGIRQILIDQTSVDPYSRRVLRVSMGAAFGMKWIDLSDVASEFRSLHERGVSTWAATLSPDSVPVEHQRLPDGPLVLVLGNEAKGLPTEVQQAASARVTIPMPVKEHAAVDSLNVAVAAAILMHETRRLRSLQA